MTELVQFRVRAPEESFKLDLASNSTLGDLLQALSLRLLKPQRQLELSSNDKSIAVNDRQVNLAFLGLDKGGALRVGLKGDGLLDTKAMFEGLLPTQGESVQYQEAETQYMRALGRSLEHNSFAGLGLEPELDEKLVKPGQKGIVIGQIIADKVVLSNKFAHLAQPGYVPAEDSHGRKSKSKNREKTNKKKHRKHSGSRSRSRRRKKKHASRSTSRSGYKKHRRDRSQSRERHHRSRERRKEKPRSRSGSNSRSTQIRGDLGANKASDGPPTMDYLSLGGTPVNAGVPQRLLAQQEEKALAIRAKLKKLKPVTHKDSDDEDGKKDHKDSKKLATRELVNAARKRTLNQAAATDKDFSVENRVKTIFQKKLSDSSTGSSHGKDDGSLQLLRSNLDSSQNRQSVLAAFDDDEQRDLSAVQNMLLAGANSKTQSKRYESKFNPRDVDQDHYNAIFSAPVNVVDVYEEPDIPMQEKRPALNWRERAKALVLERQQAQSQS